jgi:pimeloyl-ACP methyl ester carboxylesterase
MCFKPYMHDPALPGMLGKIRVPTLVVWGEDDEIIPVDCGRQYIEGIPRAELRTLRDCGHFAHMDQPQRLTSLVAEFVSS